MNMSNHLSLTAREKHPRLFPSDFAVGPIHIEALQGACRDALEDPLGVEDDLVFLACVLTIEALTRLLIWINYGTQVNSILWDTGWHTHRARR